MKSPKKLSMLLPYSLILITLMACQTATPIATPMAPTATSAPLPALSLEKWEFTCNSGILTFTVKWKDKATNETGYRVFRNGEKIVELPANATTYTDSYNFSAGENVEYYLQVFGPDGTINSSVMRLSCE